MSNLKRWKVFGLIILAIIVLFTVIVTTPIGNPSPSEAEACGFYREPPCDGDGPVPWWQWWFDLFD